MKKFSSALICVILSALISTCVVGCGGNTGNTNNSASTDTPAASSSAVASASEETQALGIGDSATVDEVTYTLDSISVTDRRNASANTTPEVVVEINYTVDNGTDTDYPSGAETAVSDASGKKCESYPLSDDPSSIPAGRSADCTAYYGMSSAGDIVIEFKPTGSTSDAALFKVTVYE